VPLFEGDARQHQCRAEYRLITDPNKRDEALASSLEDLMKFIIIGILTANVLAASCIYDAASSEPSPVAGVVAVAQTIAPPPEVAIRLSK